MTHVAQFSLQSPEDLLSLARAPLGERLRALLAAAGTPDLGAAVPPRAVQIAGLVVAEAIRLIRLGTREDLSAAALEAAEAMLDPATEVLGRLHPEAHRLMSGASVALGAASSPTSEGAELTVLRSWNGRAREAVALLMAADGQAMARSVLRTRLGNLSESHLSHLLADLEAAGLAVRIRGGRTVTVHLGPAARHEHVRELVAPTAYPGWRGHGAERDPAAEPREEPAPKVILDANVFIGFEELARTRVAAGGGEAIRDLLGPEELLTDFGSGSHVFTLPRLRSARLADEVEDEREGWLALLPLPEAADPE